MWQSTLLILFVSAIVCVGASPWDRCYKVCKCSEDGKVVVCSRRQLEVVPTIPRDNAAKIVTLGLQRNRLTQLDGAVVAARFPALETLDLRDQHDTPCVILSSPLPARVNVLGKLNHVFYASHIYFYFFYFFFLFISPPKNSL